MRPPPSSRLEARLQRSTDPARAMLARVFEKGARVTTLAFNHEEIIPRQLKPELFELDGISRESVEAHYKLYEGYVNKRNEILGKLGAVDLGAANQVYSEFRALKVELSFAIGGIKNHEIYFDHLGGGGGAPGGEIGGPIDPDFRSPPGKARAPKASGMAGPGWAGGAHRWGGGRPVHHARGAPKTLPRRK